MHKNVVASIVAGSAVWAYFLIPAQAAPLSGALARNTSAVERPDVQNVHRRCWWHRGHWHCRRYGRHRRYYYGGYPLYRRYHHGPRFGFWGPGFGLYIGPRHRYWW
jgi:hypothetical protein